MKGSSVPKSAQEFSFSGALRRNLLPSALYEHALREGEGELAANGPLVVHTGAHTGRAAQDKFILRDAKTEGEVWWERNAAITPEHFARLKADMLAYAKDLPLFTQDLNAGADTKYGCRVRVYTERAWHSLFIRNLLIRPDAAALKKFVPNLSILALPGFKADPERHGTRSKTAIAIDFHAGLILIGGTSYAGEMKKAVFTYLNYHLPAKGVVPMHCSVNVGKDGRSAVFFGLSGTGKTTLSADPARRLVGDDEHGWSPDGVFNFEGGCYAKMIHLSAKAEPQIYATTQRFGTVLENVAMDAETRRLDFDDATLTENTRGAYPIDFIDNVIPSGRAGHPTAIVMLTADAFGVLPPVALLSPSQAMYHFLSGYTAKVAGTEKGVVEPEATFSACFGGPFMPRHPAVYGKLLRDVIGRHNVSCFLLNTGWTGGGYGTGARMPIGDTRRLLSAALDGTLAKAEMRVDPYFGLDVPVHVPGIDDTLLNPRAGWADGDAYDETAKRLLGMFTRNFDAFTDYVDDDVKAAAPRLAEAAE